MGTGVLSVLVFPAYLMALDDTGGRPQHGMHTVGILAISQRIIACIDYRIQIGIQQHILGFTRSAGNNVPGLPIAVQDHTAAVAAKAKAVGIIEVLGPELRIIDAAVLFG